MDFTRKSSTMMMVLLLLLDTWSYTYGKSTEVTSSTPSTTSSHSTTGSSTSTTSSASVSSSTASQPTTTSSTSASTSSTSSTSVETSTTTDNQSSSSTSVSSSNSSPQTNTTHTDSSPAAATTIPSPSQTTNDHQSSSSATVSSTNSSPQTNTTHTDSSPAATTTIPSSSQTTKDSTTTSNQNTVTATTLPSNYSTTTVTTPYTPQVTTNGTVIDKCNQCDKNAHCNSTNGTCICNKGFIGDGTNCTDVDECKNITYSCDKNAYCNNTDGSYNCTCKNGYEGNGTNCTDEDECENHQNSCHKNAHCNNTDGSYNCTCKKGYEGNGTNCTDEDECENHQHSCHENAYCNNTEGHYNCTCKKGYEGNGTNCTDIDECRGKNDCDVVSSVCINNNGSYGCVCKPGFYFDGKQCLQARFSYVGFVKITLKDNNTSKEALMESLQKWLTSIFNSTAGFSYVEVVPINNTNRRRRRSPESSKNFNYVVYLNESTQVDTLKKHILQKCEKECNNSFFYVNGSDFRMGNDSDLCQLKGDCDPDSTKCVASNGAYGCECLNGFEYRKYPFFEKFCIDIDECTRNNTICNNGKICANLPGTYSCNCTNGYIEDPVTKQCTDVCQQNPCKNGAECTHDNRPGFYYCKCSPEWTGHDCSEAISQDNSEADKFRTILIAVGASLGSICFLLLIVTCRVCRRKQSGKHPEMRPLSAHMNDYEMNESKATYQIPRAHVSNGDDRPSKMEDKQSNYQIPRTQVDNRDERLYAEIDGGNEINILDERSIKQDKLEREPLTKSIKESHGGGAENRSFLHEEADRRRSENPGKSGVDYF